MKLTINGKEVGTIYCSVQLDKSSFDTNFSDVLDKLKNGDLLLELDKGAYKVSSYRRFYQDEKSFYLEGAVLASK